MSDMAFAVTGIAAALILVGAGLVRRRLPTTRLLALAGLWVAIIGLGWAVATLGLHLT